MEIKVSSKVFVAPFSGWPDWKDDGLSYDFLMP